jgi:hypothetical protein
MSTAAHASGKGHGRLHLQTADKTIGKHDGKDSQMMRESTITPSLQIKP